MGEVHWPVYILKIHVSHHPAYSIDSPATNLRGNQGNTKVMGGSYSLKTCAGAKGSSTGISWLRGEVVVISPARKVPEEGGFEMREKSLPQACFTIGVP